MMTMQTSDDSAGLWTLAWRRHRHAVGPQAARN
jgi:hypothetical protein